MPYKIDEVHREKDREYYQNNKERIKEKVRKHYYKYHEQNKQKQRERGRTEKAKEARRASTKKRRENIKKAVYGHYGDACSCCGEKIVEFLTIDHINGGGGKHIKSLGGAHLSEWLYYQGFPDGFRLLCMNCNFSIGKFGYCPHNKGG